MARRSSLALALALAALAPRGAPAQADAGADAGPPPLTVGVYAPRLAFPDSLARTRYAERLAAAIGAATGRPARGRGFTTGGAFFERVEAGEVDFAVVDAQIAGERPALKPLAQGTAGGRPAVPMILVVGEGVGAANIGELKGRRLATVSVGGRDARFVTNFLLQGQVEAGYFEKGRAARDAHGALSLVRLGKADAAFCFQGDAGGLRAVFTSRPVPLPVFVQARPDLDPALVAAARRAVLGVRLDHSTLDGFAEFAPATHGALRAALRAPLATPGADPVLALVSAAPPPVPAHPAPVRDLPLALPAPAAGFVHPAPPPDEF